MRPLWTCLLVPASLLVSGSAAADPRPAADPGAAPREADLAKDAGAAAAAPRPAADPGAAPREADRAKDAGAAAALGLSAGWQLRRDYGEDRRANLAPEMVGQLYLATPLERLYLRPGARLGFAGLEQAEMPRAIQLREADAYGAAELSALYDGPVIPALGVGAGLLTRWIRAHTDQPLTGDTSKLDRTELLPLVYAQLGLGLPLHGGRLLLEPFVRYEKVFGDRRIDWRFGLDATVSLF